MTTSSIVTTRGTDGLTYNDHRSRLKYIGKLQPGDNVFMANTAAGMTGEFKPHHFWVAQLLPPTVETQSVVWKTRVDLPPDCPAGSYCCKVQWFQRLSVDSRVFRLASAQYISLSCIVPVNYTITLNETITGRYELPELTQDRILTTLNGLVMNS